jgi:aminoglycoside/choline kinase family phosphotransferase
VRGWLEDYWRQAGALGIPVQPDIEDFLRASDLMGVQRHLKVIGIFARICHRDGKPRYLGDVPRFFAYIEAVLTRRPELAQLQALLSSLPRPAGATA